jgi:plastocyanin
MSAVVRSMDPRTWPGRSTVLVAMLITALSPVLGIAMLEQPAEAQGSSQVVIDNYTFAPASLTVHVGGTVVWTNRDAAPHDATTTNGPVSFASPALEQRES